MNHNHHFNPPRRYFIFMTQIRINQWMMVHIWCKKISTFNNQWLNLERKPYTSNNCTCRTKNRKQKIHRKSVSTWVTWRVESKIWRMLSITKLKRLMSGRWSISERRIRKRMLWSTTNRSLSWRIRSWHWSRLTILSTRGWCSRQIRMITARRKYSCWMPRYSCYWAIPASKMIWQINRRISCWTWTRNWKSRKRSSRYIKKVYFIFLSHKEIKTWHEAF